MVDQSINDDDDESNHLNTTYDLHQAPAWWRPWVTACMGIGGLGGMLGGVGYAVWALLNCDNTGGVEARTKVNGELNVASVLMASGSLSVCGSLIMHHIMRMRSTYSENNHGREQQREYTAMDVNHTVNVNDNVL